jgi:hypothetical protein
MAQSLLIGYSVEQDGDKLVITLSGAMASQFLEQFASRGHGGRSRTLPILFPFDRLGSAGVRLQGGNGAADADAPPDLKEIFGQGFDRDLEAFDDSLAQYRALLGGVEEDEIVDEEVPAPPARPRPRKTRKGAGAAN